MRTPPGGWLHPWPNVAELARVLPHERWTLIGGLMTQLHAFHKGVNAVRPTNDVDIVLHIETARGTPRDTALALESLGYELRESVDPRRNIGHRFTRGAQRIDVVGDSDQEPSADDIVDVVVADHAAPSVHETLRRHEMFRIEGGTQALRRTANYVVELERGEHATISVPRPFGALILKAAAYITDTRDRGRHLEDAAVLLACVQDPIAELEKSSGSDRSRLLTLADELTDAHPAWQLMPASDAERGRAVLRVLTVADE